VQDTASSRIIIIIIIIILLFVSGRIAGTVDRQRIHISRFRLLDPIRN